VATLTAATLAPRPSLADARRLVVKIGSALLVDRATGLRADWLASLAQDVARPRARGAQVILVSSGSIALGRGVLELPAGSLPLEQSQAAAAVGQIRLARAYEEVLAPHGLVAGQVLVTLETPPTAAATSTPARRWRPCWASASSLSSTRTTQSPPTRSATATTTASPRRSP
jgi:glutamate 5-kinase